MTRKPIFKCRTQSYDVIAFDDGAIEITSLAGWTVGRLEPPVECADALCAAIATVKKFLTARDGAEPGLGDPDATGAPAPVGRGKTENLSNTANSVSGGEAGSSSPQPGAARSPQKKSTRKKST